MKRTKKSESKTADPTSPDPLDNKFKHISKGKAEVDEKFSMRHLWKVYEDESGNQCSAYLMKSDLNKNNNKFYIIQLLQHTNTSTGKFGIHTRFGRVGDSGVQNFKDLNLPGSIKEYNKVYRQKTGAGKGYTALEMNFGNDEDEQDNERTAAQSQSTMAPSKLEQPVQDLLSFIFDKGMMEQSVASVGYDIKKLPLGKLSAETVKQGYSYLTKIEELIKGAKKKWEEKHSGTFTLNSAQQDEVLKLSGKFYTYIPHNFGRSKMSNFTIDTLEKVKQKTDLVSTLSDMAVAFKSKDSGKNEKKRQKVEVDQDLTPNVIDTNYETLKCDIEPIQKGDDTFKMIDQYIQNTKGYEGGKLLDAFSLDREGEDSKFNPLDLKNQKLLWHGSRFSNFVGILSQGMRIAPPEAPKTGYLYGKGVYFADCFGKSAPYCRAGLSGNVALLLLCQVALGTPVELTNSNSNIDDTVKNSKGVYDSCYAKGGQQPDPKSDINKGDFVIPNGKVINNSSGGWGGYNEYIVYNTNQVRMKYLVKVKLN